jgi:hypothetical protein
MTVVLIRRRHRLPRVLWQPESTLDMEYIANRSFIQCKPSSYAIHVAAADRKVTRSRQSFLREKNHVFRDNQHHARPSLYIMLP